MQAVILAGGLGTRISEETDRKPKPMVEIGGKPILWHIMKIYSAYGIRDFIICLGYKGYVVKEYFANYYLHTSDVTFDIKRNKRCVHRSGSEPWKVTLVDTGEDTATGGRIKRVRKYIKSTFCMTYGDSLSNINIAQEIAFHRRSKAAATLAAVQAPSRFGALTIEGDVVEDFREKLAGDGGWINGGFFVLEPAAVDYIHDDSMPWELAPLRALTSKNQLRAFKHTGFWHAMDTLRDKHYLEELWNSGKAPWRSDRLLA